MSERTKMTTMPKPVTAAQAGARQQDGPLLRWATPEHNLWVASVDGEFAGYLEFSEGHYVATGAAGEPQGTYATLVEAKAALGDLSQPEPQPNTHGTRLLAALTSGVAALTVTGAVMALGWLHL